MKKIVLPLLAIMSVIVGTSSVSALTYSANLKGPEVFSGQTTQSAITNITTPTYSSVRGDRTYLYITNFGYLRSNVCQPDNNRTVTVNMYEDDVYPNEDELVKTYIFGFTGLQMTYGVYGNNSPSITTHHPGNIDSSDDPTAELYITTYLSQVAGDRSTTNGEIFYYQYAVD